MVRCGRTVVVEWHSRRNNRLWMVQWELGIRAVHQSDAAPVLIIVSASLQQMTLPLLDFFALFVVLFELQRSCLSKRVQLPLTFKWHLTIETPMLYKHERPTAYHTGWLTDFFFKCRLGKVVSQPRTKADNSLCKLIQSWLIA